MVKTVITQSTWKGDMRVEGLANNHTLIIDQPSNMGGSDAGPNPLEYLLVALGSCLGTVAAIVARQEHIKLEGFSIEIEGDYDLDFLMGKTTDGEGGFLEIRQKVSIDADLDEDEKSAFFEKVHARCPVSGSLLNQTRITTEIQ
ncbi:MAG: OsmC family protein [Brevefilum sp.]|nr:OsmC family protein [Brevefilum sp.]